MIDWETVRQLLHQEFTEVIQAVRSRYPWVVAWVGVTPPGEEEHAFTAHVVFSYHQARQEVGDLVLTFESLPGRAFSPQSDLARRFPQLSRHDVVQPREYHNLNSGQVCGEKWAA